MDSGCKILSQMGLHVDVETKICPISKEELETELAAALVASFNLALKTGRIRVGLSESSSLLDIDPSACVFCLVPCLKKKNDALKHLHLLLVEAFCREHSIPLTKVESMDGFCVLLKLAQTLSASPSPYEMAPLEISDLIIIQKMQGEMTDNFQAIWDSRCRQKANAALCFEDEHLQQVYRRLMEVASAFPTLPAVFPTFFDA